MEKIIHTTQTGYSNNDNNKKEMLLKKLENKLGKSRNEVKKLMSDSLLSLLAQVPFKVG